MYSASRSIPTHSAIYACFMVALSIHQVAISSILLALTWLACLLHMKLIQRNTKRQAITPSLRVQFTLDVMISALIAGGSLAQLLAPYPIPQIDTLQSPIGIILIVIGALLATKAISLMATAILARYERSTPTQTRATQDFAKTKTWALERLQRVIQAAHYDLATHNIQAHDWEARLKKTSRTPRSEDPLMLADDLGLIMTYPIRVTHDKAGKHSGITLNAAVIRQALEGTQNDNLLFAGARPSAMRFSLDQAQWQSLLALYRGQPTQPARDHGQGRRLHDGHRASIQRPPELFSLFGADAQPLGRPATTQQVTRKTCTSQAIWAPSPTPRRGSEDPAPATRVSVPGPQPSRMWS